MRHIFMILAMLMALPGFAYDFTVDGIYYDIRSSSGMTVAVVQNEYARYTGDVVIPNTVNYAGKTYIVMAIEENAFNHCENLKSIVIPETVTDIGEYAFNGCKNLASVTLSQKGIKGIKYATFQGCRSLTHIELPNTITYIEGASFSGSGLTSIAIPNSVEKIKTYAFAACESLVSVEFPNSLTEIEICAFYLTPNVKFVYCHWEDPAVCEGGTSPRDENSFLYVPIGCKEAYQRVSPWNEFKNIQEIQYAGNEDVVDDESVPVSVENGVVTVGGDGGVVNIYDMDGRTVYAGTERNIVGLTPGVYLVKVGKSTVKLSI